MEIIGLIAEYNPFHNGHLYQIKKIKELYPNSIIILVLNGYFLQRGQVSLESKKEKTRLALKYGIDLVVELPFVFGSNSADIFADAALELLNELKITKLVFGSESNDIKLLKKIAKKQLEKNFDLNLKKYLDEGINYPTALNKAIGIPLKEPNDLLGVSYIKTILKNNYNIEPVLIKRTNNYHDILSSDKIVSASNIREKLNNNIDIKDFIPEGHINKIDEYLLFSLIKYKIITDDELDKYLSVDEGIDKRLKKVIKDVNYLDELVSKVKSKRYTYNRIMRMLMHILIGLKKEDKEKLKHNEYIRLLGLNASGQRHINKIKKDLELPIVSKFSTFDSKIKTCELKVAFIYQMLTKDNVLDFEYANKPIKLSIDEDD